MGFQEIPMKHYRLQKGKSLILIIFVDFQAAQCVVHIIRRCFILPPNELKLLAPTNLIKSALRRCGDMRR